MRLIDADALIEKIYEIDKKYGIGAFGDGLEMAKELVLNMPTIEPERPHGEWVKKYNTEDPTPVCFVCGFDTEDQVYFNFCPNCGADMRKEGESN